MTELKKSIMAKNSFTSIFEVLLYLYLDNTQNHTKYAFYVYKLIQFGSMPYIYGKF